jgi:hypothetical protein
MVNRSDTFSKMLTILQAVQATDKGFDAVKEKCQQLYPIVKEFSLVIVSHQTFDSEYFDPDREALPYLRNYVLTEDNKNLQKHLPVKINSSNGCCIYTAIALLCQLDIAAGPIELRVRNVIDLVLNIHAYYLDNPELHQCVKWPNTWQNFVWNLLTNQSSVSVYTTSSTTNFITSFIRDNC